MSDSCSWKIARKVAQPKTVIPVTPPTPPIETTTTLVWEKPVKPWGAQRTAGQILADFTGTGHRYPTFPSNVKLGPDVWDRVSPEPALQAQKKVLVEAPPPSTTPHVPKKHGLAAWT